MYLWCVFCVQVGAMKTAPAMKTMAPAMTNEVRNACLLQIIPNCAFSLLLGCFSVLLCQFRQFSCGFRLFWKFRQAWLKTTYWSLKAENGIFGQIQIGWNLVLTIICPKRNLWTNSNCPQIPFWPLLAQNGIFGHFKLSKNSVLRL